MVQEKANAILEALNSATATNQEELEQFRIQYISKRSVIGALMGEMRNIPNEEKKAFGVTINNLKQTAQTKFKALIDGLENNNAESKAAIDLTLPPLEDAPGSTHPITAIRQQITQIFERLGFNLSEGPEIEDDWHNFTALNFPPNHPAREMQDTFFIQQDKEPEKAIDELALRTHTSSVQVRVMEDSEPPIRTLSIGRVFRNEAISARAHCIFHQVEGLYVDKNVSFLDLKQTVYHFVKELFGKDTKIRFRPSYFPFTEPSAEIDISCNICKGKGCNICKHTGWVEIAGSGMVDPNVLKNCGIDPEAYTGFAFGMGLERITMLKYQVNDLRLFTENDVRFLKQFKTL